MTLPSAKESEAMKWPTPPQREVNAYYDAYYAWWKGDTKALVAIYQGGNTSIATQDMWYGRPLDNGASRKHVSVPKQVANIVSNSLFSESPRTASEDKVIQDIIGICISNPKSDSNLIQLGEFISALGGGFAIGTWDIDSKIVVSEEVVDPRTVTPTFNNVTGELDSGIHSKDIYTKGNIVHRLLREFFMRFDLDLEGNKIPGTGRGVISHARYHGTKDKLGTLVSIDAGPETEYLLGIVDENDEIVTEVPDIALHYIPNATPSTVWGELEAGYSLGRSDFEGNTGIFDEIDETATLLNTEKVISIARLYVSEGAAEANNSIGSSIPGMEPLDVGKPVGIKANQLVTLIPGGMGSSMKEKLPMELVQPDIRVEPYLKLKEDHLKSIAMTAGISNSSLGLVDTRPNPTATQILSETKNEVNANWNRQLAAKPAILRLQRWKIYMYADLKKITLPSEWDISLEWQDGSRTDPMATSSQMSIEASSGVVPPKDILRLRFPDASDTELDKKVDELKDWLRFQASLSAAQPAPAAK